MELGGSQSFRWSAEPSDLDKIRAEPEGTRQVRLCERIKTTPCKFAGAAAAGCSDISQETKLFLALRIAAWGLQVLPTKWKYTAIHYCTRGTLNTCRPQHYQVQHYLHVPTRYLLPTRGTSNFSISRLSQQVLSATPATSQPLTRLLELPASCNSLASPVNFTSYYYRFLPTQPSLELFLLFSFSPSQLTCPCADSDNQISNSNQGSCCSQNRTPREISQ
ncbi:hypothetical protein F5Y14DRAFT_219031 [Nemania sp. NC0429]|nr:hypothetical protein F5Y14DRAFT_219031 [Nemania sp. NC0429]